MNKARPDSSDSAGPENAEDDLSSDLYEFRPPLKPPAISCFVTTEH